MGQQHEVFRLAFFKKKIDILYPPQAMRLTKDSSRDVFVLLAPSFDNELGIII